MQFNIRQFNVTYQATFSQLAFPLTEGEGAVKAMRTFYESINPRYSINTEDVHVFTGSSLSDLKIQLLLFGKLGEIELTAQHLKATFKSAVSWNDLTLIRDCVTLCLNALSGWWPNVRFREEILQYMAILEPSDSANGEVTGFLDRTVLTISGKTMMAKEFGASEIHFRPNLILAEKQAGWTIDLHLYPSDFIQNTLIVTGAATYSASGSMDTIEKKFDHAVQMSKIFLNRHDVELPKPNQS